MLRTIFGFIARLVFVTVLVGVFAGAIVYGVRYIQDNSSDEEVAVQDEDSKEESSKSDSDDKEKAATSTKEEDSTDTQSNTSTDESSSSVAQQEASESTQTSNGTNGELPQAGSSSLVASVAVVAIAAGYLSYHKLRDQSFDNQQINR